MGATDRPFRWVKYAWVPALLALGGCGGPSGSDIKGALEEATQLLLGPQMAPTIEDVSNVNCQAAQGQPGYVCSYNITSIDKMSHTRQSGMKEGRFVQNGSKWVAMGN